MKRAILVLLAAVLCLSASGCGSFLEADYIVAKAYVDDLPVIEGDTLLISSYQSLKNAIIAMVNAHQEEETLTFSGYGGDVSKDLPRACSELKTENALCAYAVDYISYDLSRIVSYYEAKITVNYLRSAEQMSRLHTIGSVSNAEALLRVGLLDMEPTLIFSAVGHPLNAEDIQNFVSKEYYTAPAKWLQLPQASLSVYPNEGITRIYEVSFNYGGDAEKIGELIMQMSTAAAEITAQISGDEDDCAALAAALLAERCSWAPDGSDLSLTAYGALVNGSAASEGFAMAYKTLCDMLEIECLVIAGRLDKTPHVWNMVRLGESYYHVDTSQIWDTGAASILHSDSDMWGRYWWDTELYPESGNAVIGGEPTVAPEPAPVAEEPLVGEDISA